MIYLVIVGLVVAGFFFAWALVEIIGGERAKREREALREAARLAHDTQADQLNREMDWRG